LNGVVAVALVGFPGFLAPMALPLSRVGWRLSTLVLLVLAGSLAPLSAKPADWAKEIDALTASDAAQPPPAGAVVFVGSSSIRFWESLAADFPAFTVIRRGFGGSEMADTVYYADRLVLPYHPRAVVVYAGENDLWDGKTPEQVAADFREFRTRVHAALPRIRILYLSIKASPSRARIVTQVREANRLIAADCAAQANCLFVDVATPLLDAHGGYRPELFREDQLHMRPAGYAIWTRILTPLLQP
jgi:hypothetical protein